MERLNVVNVNMLKINFKRLLIVFISFILIIGYYFLARFNIFTIDCPFKYFLNIYCPGCGVSRMLIEITKLNFKQAFYYNRLFFILMPMIIILMIDIIVNYILDRPYKIIKKIPKSVYITLCIVIVLFGIIRNIDIFNYLSPIVID